MSVTYSEPGIFNVLDPWVDVVGYGYIGMVANIPTGHTPANNTAVLLGIIQLAQAYSKGKCPTGTPFGAQPRKLEHGWILTERDCVRDRSHKHDAVTLIRSVI